MPSSPFNAAYRLCAGAAQAAALCSLVIRGAQRGLTKAVTRTAAAEHALSICIKCGRRASLRAGGLAREPVPPGYVAAPDPYAVKGGSGRAQEVPDPYGGPRSRPSAQVFPCLEARGVSGPIPGGERVRGRWPSEGRAWPVGPGYSVPSTQLQITTQVLPCCSKSGYPCYMVPTVAPGPPWGRCEPTGGATFAIWLHSVSAGALTGFDHLSGWLLPHHIATAY